MKNTSQADPVQEFHTQFTSVLSTQRFVLGVIGIGFVIIVLFGALVFAIVLGLFLGFVMLALTFDLPYRLLRHLFRLEDLPTHLIVLPLKRIVFNCASLVIPLFFILIGVRGLQNFGFCSQALLCTFGRLLAP